MTESNAKNDQPEEPQREFSQEQYDMLVRCSKKENIREWNDWRRRNPNVPVRLEGASFREAYLVGVNLYEANLQKADFWRANLQGGNLCRANLRGASLWYANLRKAQLMGSTLLRAKLECANLQGADLREANLQGADLTEAHLQGANLSAAILRGTHFYIAAVDGETIILIHARDIDKDTDFTGVGLDTARLEPALKQMLKYNIRRRRWRAWYKLGPWWKRWPKKAFIQPFWWMSDYGRSTGRIVGCFFALALVFALIYFCWPHFLMVKDQIAAIRGFWHALYFSVVTMTTLGFGDIHANPDSWVGQGLLMAQVLFGYVLLAALVTRFAVLFQAGGPAGKFARKEKD